MYAHLKNEKGIEKVLDNIREIANGQAEIKFYSTFYEVELPKDLFASYFSEEHYLNRDYCIRLYNRSNREKVVIIPLKFIDCIFSL